MKLGVLYSGGKDSTLAMLKAKEFHQVVCLITLVSANKESYMFQTPNVHMTELQAEALGLPLVRVETKGEKETELADLTRAIADAKRAHQIEGIVTGAVRSTYQASRIQRICHELGVWCFNPLWLKDQVELLKDVVKSGIVAMISGVFAEPLDKSFLGKKIDKKMIKKLEDAAESHGINPAGEGGEIETTVLHAPGFKKEILVKKTYISYENFSGICHINEAELR